MAEKVSNIEEKGLSVKQEQLIAELVSGKTIKASAVVVGIAEKTAHVWLKQPLFKKEYQAAKQGIFDTTLDKLRDGTSIALKTLLKHMTSEETKPYVQVQAAKIWMDAAIDIHRIGELDRRLVHLEEITKAGAT